MNAAGEATGGRLPPALTLAILTELVMNGAGARSFAAGPFVSHWPFTTFGGALFVGVAVLWIKGSPRLSLSSKVSRFLPLLPLIAAITSVFIRGVLVPGPLLACGLVAVAGAVAFLVASFLSPTPSGSAFLSLPPRTWLVIGCALLSGVALRVFELTLLPINPERADMLPLVLLAGRNALGGHPPYAFYHFPWPVPLTYLPLGWLAYAPLFLTSVDPRWTSCLAELTVLAAILFAGRHPGQETARDAATIVWATWFLSTRLVADDGFCASSPQWAALAWTAALAMERNRWTPVVAGGAVATTLLVVPLLPFVALSWGRSRSAGGEPLVPSVLRFTGIVAVVAALLIVPWFLWSPSDFIAGVFTWFNHLDGFPREKWIQGGAWAAQPGLAGLFWTFHLEHLLKPLQLVVLSGVFWIFLRLPRDRSTPAAVGPFLVAAALLFLALNPVIWAYLWEAALVLALVTAAADRSARFLRVEPASSP